VNLVVQQAINALSTGALYALLALGLAIVFSVMGLVNFAHGELITITGFAMLGFEALGIPMAVLLPLGVLVSTLAAVLMERVAFRPVRGAPGTTMLLTSFGVSIVIQNFFLLTVEPKPRAVVTPSWFRTRISVGSLTIQTLQILTALATVAALLILVLVLRRTTTGLAMRAASERFDVVRLMGIRADRVVTAAFAVSGFLAGIAAVFIISKRGAVDPFMGFIPVIKAFVATVLGGFGSLSGAVIGGLFLGVIEVTLDVYLGPSVEGFRDAFVFLVVGGLLVIRPQGLLGVRARVTT
jgi:branched-chain amino acid transport system permease protein